MKPWPELKWWSSPERLVCEGKIDDLEAKGVVCNPTKDRLYQALKEVREEDCRACIIGQDPYPDSRFATGVAFSIPREIGERSFPQTLRLILKEYVTDLHYTFPSHGDLSQWCSQGVLLWNAVPSVQSGRPLSNDWREWRSLTSEIIERLSERGVAFAFLGAVARSFSEGIPEGCRILTSHPSVRGNINSKSPFTGSRLFSSLNAKLVANNKEPIDWGLSPKEIIVQKGNILRNITGVNLGLSKARLPLKAKFLEE